MRLPAALLLSMVSTASLAADTVPADLVGTWRVERIGETTLTGEIKSTLRIGTDGKVAGHAGCNRWFAAATFDGNVLSLGEAGTTRMLCPQPVMEQERAFLGALGEVRSWTRDGNTLALNTAAGQPAMVLALELPAPAFAGSDWLATAIGGKPVAEGVQSTLTLDWEQRRISGVAACNRYGAGVAAFDGTNLSFADAMSTLMACTSTEATEQERAFLAAIGATRSFTIDGEALVFAAEDGSEVLRFSPAPKAD